MAKRLQAAAIVLSILTTEANAQSYFAQVVHVLDGDTIDVCKRVVDGACDFGSKVRVRIADIDTPELHGAKCELEREHARVIRNYVVMLLLTEHVAVRPRKIDKYGRDFAYVTLRGLDVGQHLLERGFAKPWLDHQPKPRWCK